MFANNNDNNHVRPILYYDDINPHSRAVLMILNMLDVDIELRAVEMIKGEHLKPAYAKINPARTVPTMVHKDLVITDNAIFPYVCENHDNEKAKQLIAFKCYKRHCRVLSRLFFESQVLHRIHGQLMTDLVRKTIFETDVGYHKRKVEHAYDVMETYLKDGPYMAGSVLTAADISFVACLGALDMMFPIDADRTRWEKLNDWFRRMRSLTVQKINTNGIEKQRRLVEHYAKFQFATDVRRFTAGIRNSLIPRFSISYRRCSIGVQTIPPQETEHINEPSTMDTSHKVKVVEKSAGDLNYGIIEIPQQMQRTDVSTQGLVTETDSKAPLQTPAMLSNPLLVELLDNFVAKPMAIDPAKVVVSNLAERSYGGAHKERPPVPPKRGRTITSATTAIPLSTPDSGNKRVVKKSTQLEVGMKVVEEKYLKVTKENDNKKDTCCCAASLITKSCLPEISKNLCRLDGGVEPMMLRKMPPRNEFLIPPVRAFPLTLVINSTDASEGSQKTSLAPKPATAINSSETSSDTLDKKPSKIPQLPPGLPINSPQVALQYSRRPYAPNVALSAPPPTPDNSSQDEQNDFEFPPPPSEVLIQNPSNRGKATQGTKLADTNKVSTESVTKTVGTKSSGLKPATNNSKATGESMARTIGKKSSDSKSLTAKKHAAVEPKVCKFIRKTKTGLLLASGTKSPCSNISQASLAKHKVRIVKKTLSEANTMQMLMSAATNKKPQEKKTRKLEESSGVKIVASAGSTVNACKKVSGRSLVSNGPAALNSKATEKRRRAEGGGQWRSKENTLQLAVDTQMKLLKAVFNTSTGAEAKPAAVGAEKCNTTAIKSAKPVQQSTKTAEKTNQKISTKSVQREVKSMNTRLGTKTKLKVSPTKASEPNPIKSTKTFDTRPCKPSVGCYQSQPKIQAQKRPITKYQKKSESKVASEEVLSAPKLLPLETACASVLELKCVRAGSTTEQNTTTDIAKPVNVTSEINLAKNQQQSAVVPTESRSLHTAIETTDISTTPLAPLTSKVEQSSCFAVRDVPVSVGLVAKALRILSAAKPSVCSATTNISKALPPKPPPLPPSPEVFHLELPTPPPLPTPPTPPNFQRNDALPPVGTVAKALQSLGAVTSEAKPLCGTAKTFKIATLSVRNTEVESKALVVKNKAEYQKIPHISEATVDARPLAAILTATVQRTTKDKVEHTNATGLTNETQQSQAKSKNLLDNTVANMVQAAEEETMTTNLNQMTDAVLLDYQRTPSLAWNESKNAAEGSISGSEELQKLNTSAEETICDTQKKLNSAPLVPPKAIAPIEVVASLAKVEPIAVVVPPKEDANSLFSETLEKEKPYPMIVACPDATNLTESAVKPPQAAESTTQTPENNRNVIQRALISEGIVVLEPTPLPAQQNIIISGYTRTEPNNVDTLFASTGRALGNTIAHSLRGHSAGSCSHGPSSNVVISTFGYTPMSGSDSASEQILPIIPKYIAPPPPPPSPPLLRNATTTKAAADKLAEQCQSELPVGALSPRTREDRPYPTAHRSRSQRAGERKTIKRGRVM